MLKALHHLVNRRSDTDRASDTGTVNAGALPKPPRAKAPGCGGALCGLLPMRSAAAPKRPPEHHTDRPRVSFRPVAANAMAPAELALRAGSTAASSSTGPQVPVHKRAVQVHTHLVPGDQCKLGMARWPDARFNKEAEPGNRKYGLAFAEGCRVLGAAVRDGLVGDVHTLWGSARAWRAERSPDNPAFGRERGAKDVNFDTGIHDQYLYMAEHILKSSRGTASVRHVAGHAWHDVSLSQETLIQGQRLQLTRCIVNTDGQGRLAMHKIGSSDWAGEMKHPDPGVITPIFEEAQRIFERARSNSMAATRGDPANVKALLGQLGEIHWLLTNALPDPRGSAAKAEMTVRALAYALGVELAPFAKGISPDIESFVQTREAFRDGAYEAMFESAPVGLASGEKLPWQPPPGWEAPPAPVSPEELEASINAMPPSVPAPKRSLLQALNDLDED